MNKPKLTAKSNKMYAPVPSVAITFLLFFGSQLIASLIIILFMALVGWDQQTFNNWYKTSSWPQFIYVSIVDLIMVYSIYKLLKARKLNFRSIGFKKPVLSDLYKAFLGYGVYILVFLALSIAISSIFKDINFEQEQQLGFEAKSGFMNILLAGISLVILPPIVEEMLTRGFLYTGLRTKLNFVPAMIIASLVFATAHLQFGNDAPLLWVAAIDTFALSMVLVYLREKTGSLAASIFLHAIKNSLAFYFLFIK